MKSKLQLIQKNENTRKKCKNEQDHEILMKDYRTLIMEMEWLRMRKIKMAYLLYLNYEIGSNHFVLSNLAKMNKNLQEINGIVDRY